MKKPIKKVRELQFLPLIEQLMKGLERKIDKAIEEIKEIKEKEKNKEDA